MLERISKFPIVIDHNSSFSKELEMPVLPERAPFVT